LMTFNTHFLPAAELDGDYNDDGRVDAADYVVWRKNDGSPAGYSLWRTNFGRSLAGSAAGAGLAATSIPEPSALLIAILGGIGLLAIQRPLIIANKR